jgi:hypothetical protein
MNIKLGTFSPRFGWTWLLMLLLLACSGAPNFSLTFPKEVSLEQGQSTQVALSVNPEGGFANNVQLAVVEAPSQVVVTFDPPTTRFRTSVKLEVKPELGPGEYPIKLRATAGAISKTVETKLTVLTPAFTISLPNPGNLPTPSLGVERGASVEATLSLTRRSGFLGTVALSLEEQTGQPLASGITYTFSPANVANTINGSILKISIDKSIIAQPGDYNLRVKAKAADGSSEQLLPFLLKVTNPPNPDYSLSASVSSLNITQLGTQELTVAVNRVGGMEEAVGLSLEKADGTPLPSGLSAVFDPTSVDKATPSSKLKITVAPGVLNQTHALKIKGSVGTQNRFADLSLKVELQPEVLLSASGTQLTIRQGREDNLDLLVSSVAGFSGPVALKIAREDGTALPAGVSQPNLDADSVTLSPNGQAVRSIKVAVSRDVAVGSYKLRIEGRPNSPQIPAEPPRIFNFTLVVKPEVDPDFLMTGPLNLDWEDILENRFQFGVGTIRYGSFADPIALEFVSPPESFENLAFGKNSLASTDSGTSVSFTPKQAGEFPLVVKGSAGGLIRTVTITVKVRNFNLGFYGNRDETLSPGQTAIFDVTRNAGYQFDIKLKVLLKKADGSFVPLTDDAGSFIGAGEAPEIENITFTQVGDGVEVPNLTIPGGPGTPIPSIRLRVITKANAPAKVLNLRVEGRSQAPAIPQKRSLGELQYRVTDFTVNITP